ncbi:MAG TPA: prepilin-type N-terminal cleavage/methylation domain-containing protein [Sedimentisphaerales bacterium]|nr:prepilin-type N-terminal cleavage/methylation domain-containing protein [Sedimentisphaerales bacterium]
MNRSQADKVVRSRGFTLIEILLVMLISSIFVLGINATYRQVHSVWSNVEDRRIIYHNARIVTKTLRQELSCLYLPAAPDGNDDAETDKAFQPVSVEPTELTFYTLAPSWKASLVSSRMAKVRYSFTKDEYTNESVLQRFEQPCAGEKPIGKESSDVILKGLSDFSVSAVGNGSNGGDEKKNAPPKALKVSLKWPATKVVPEINFQTTILIPCQASVGPGG